MWLCVFSCGSTSINHIFPPSLTLKYLVWYGSSMSSMSCVLLHGPLYIILCLCMAYGPPLWSPIVLYCPCMVPYCPQLSWSAPTHQTSLSQAEYFQPSCVFLSALLSCHTLWISALGMKAMCYEVTDETVCLSWAEHRIHTCHIPCSLTVGITQEVAIVSLQSN